MNVSQSVSAPAIVVEDDLQLSFTSSGKDVLIEKLKNIDVNTLTPIEAMTTLFELQKDAKTL